MIQNLINDLTQKGWAQTSELFQLELCQKLRKEALELQKMGVFVPAQVGRNQARASRVEIRSDLICWLDQHKPLGAFAQAWVVLDQLRQEINRSLFLGLVDWEGHYGLYQPGTHYKRHLDQFQKGKERILSTVLYLNPDWQNSDAGAICLYQGETLEVATEILPQMGTFVCFLSADIYHEVLPPQKERLSLTGWFRNERSLI